MKIQIKEDETTEEFLRESGDLLYKNEAINSLMLGLCLSWKPSPTSPEIRLFRVVEGDVTKTVAVQTPPFNLIVTFAQDEELEILATHMANKGFDLPGVVGPSKESIYFSQKWSVLTGKETLKGMFQKIYQADKAILPSVEGFLIEAGLDEEELVAQWLYEFSAESLPEREKFALSFAKESAKKAIESRNAYLWMVNGDPVSVAHTGRPTKNGISIRAVYTPPEQRKNGYGSAVVGHLTKRMLEQGFKFCCLYTDLENPTSNKIYQDVGYKEVVDSKHFLFLSKR